MHDSIVEFSTCLLKQFFLGLSHPEISLCEIHMLISILGLSHPVILLCEIHDTWTVNIFWVYLTQTFSYLSNFIMLYTYNDAWTINAFWVYLTQKKSYVKYTYITSWIFCLYLPDIVQLSHARSVLASYILFIDLFFKKLYQIPSSSCWHPYPSFKLRFILCNCNSHFEVCMTNT